jgi:hypothetical protein
MVPVALRAPSTMPAPQPCSVLIPCFEVTNSETAGYAVTFWADHAVSEIKVTHIRLADE